MASEPVPAEPVPSPETKPPSGWWKWTKRIGCTFLLTVLAFTLTCCGLACGGVWWIDSSVRNANKDEVDRLHELGMQRGDVQAMHERADPEFRKKHNLETLRAFINERPWLLERENLVGMDFRRQVIGGVEFVKVKSRRRWFAQDDMEIVFKVIDNVLVLIGISPGLDELVPSSFRHRGASGRRRHFHWD